MAQDVGPRLCRGLVEQAPAIGIPTRCLSGADGALLAAKPPRPGTRNGVVHRHQLGQGSSLHLYTEQHRFMCWVPAGCPAASSCLWNNIYLVWFLCCARGTQRPSYDSYHPWQQCCARPQPSAREHRLACVVLTPTSTSRVLAVHCFGVCDGSCCRRLPHCCANAPVAGGAGHPPLCDAFLSIGTCDSPTV